MHARIHPLCLSLMPVTCYYWLMQLNVESIQEMQKNFIEME